MKTIVSTIIGALRQDERFHDWWKSEDIAVPFFGGKALAVVFMGYEPEADSEFIGEADSALRNFLNLGEADRLKISEHVHRNCMDFLEAVEFDPEVVDERVLDINDTAEVWAFVHPQQIHVRRRHRRDRDIYITVACECDWEEEHGLQLVFRQGRQLTRVSDQDDHLTNADAYDVPDSEDALLSSFKA